MGLLLVGGLGLTLAALARRESGRLGRPLTLGDLVRGEQVLWYPATDIMRLPSGSVPAEAWRPPGPDELGAGFTP